MSSNVRGVLSDKFSDQIRHEIGVVIAGFGETANLVVHGLLELKCRPDARHELTFIDWPREEIVGAAFDALNSILSRVE